MSDLLQICVDDARSVNPKIKLGLTYVSCSPKRVTVARLAAAQAALEAK